jgi:hypothetical protein
MDVITRSAFERPDFEAHRPGCNPRQHGACLAVGARWSSQDDHDAIAFGSGGSVTELSVTGRTEGAVMNQHGTFAIPAAGQYCSLSKS